MTVVDSGGANQFDLVTGPALPSVGPIGRVLLTLVERLDPPAAVGGDQRRA